MYYALRGQEDRILRQSTVFVMDASQERAFRVKLKGEGVDDHGGPYSQLFTDVCNELQSSVPILPLFVRTPNNISQQGQNQEKFMINPHLPSMEGAEARLDL